MDLRQCQKALSLHTLLLEQLKNAGIEPVNADIFLKLLAEGKILLVFDAFDEMATMSNAEITLNNFRQLNQAVTGEAKVILTSRTHYFRDKFEVDKILKKQGVERLSQHATMLLREVYDKPEWVLSVAISGDNRRLVSASYDHTVKLWDLETGRLEKTLKGHHDYVVSVTFSPDNRRLVSGSLDNTMKIWDIQTGEIIYSISLLPGNNAITLFKDNQFLASSDTALQYLYYTDGLARYPALDLPELRCQKTDD